MRSHRATLAALAIALTAGAGAAAATDAEAAGLRVQADLYAGHADYQPVHYSYDWGGYYHRPGYRYRYYFPRHYPHHPRYRWRDHRKRDFLNCRWVPGEGRVCW